MKLKHSRRIPKLQKRRVRLPNKRTIQRNHSSQLKFSKKEIARLQKQLAAAVDDIFARFRKVALAADLVHKHAQLISE